MSIQVADKVIETDEEGYLVNADRRSAEAGGRARRLTGRLSRAPDPAS